MAELLLGRGGTVCVAHKVPGIALDPADIATCLIGMLAPVLPDLTN